MVLVENKVMRQGTGEGGGEGGGGGSGRGRPLKVIARMVRRKEEGKRGAP
jgi:hypothetical protein